MSNKPRLIGLLTPSQSEVLKTLYELRKQTSVQSLWKPKELGAFRSSHHAMTLKRLQDKGWVERVPLDDSKQFGYRITDSGVETWTLLCDVSLAPLHAVFGGRQSRERAELLAHITA